MAVLNSNGIVLRAVTANKFISQTVVAVRCKIRCEKLISELLLEHVALNDSVLIRRTGRIHTHLEILVIHGNLMEGKFQIGKNAELTGAVAVFLIRTSQISTGSSMATDIFWEAKRSL